MKNTLSKLAAALTALALSAGALPSALFAHAEENTVVRGDVNLDGCVDAADIQAMKDLLGSTAATIFSEEAENSTAYDITQEGLIDSRDLYALIQYVDENIAFPTELSQISEDTIHMRISDGECFSGSTVTLNVGFVDWTKDIAGYDVVLRFDDCFTVANVSCTGSGCYATEGTAIKLFGSYTDKEAWRGNIASVTLVSKEKFSGSAHVAVESANVFDTAYDFYTPQLDTANVEIYDVFAPVGVRQAGISSKSAMISWEMPFSDQPIVGYNVYRDGELLAEVPAEQHSYLDTAVELGTEYTYNIRAILDTGVQSNDSRAVTAAPQMMKFRSTGFSSSKVSVDDSELQILLEQPIMLDSVSLTLQDSKGMTDEQIIPLNGASLDEIRSNIDVGAYPTGQYSMSIVLKDVDGATISTSFIFEIYTNPPHLVMLAGHSGERSVTLTWGLAEDTAATGYRIYRKTASESDWTVVAEVRNRTTLSYKDTRLTADMEYFYAVKVFDGFGLESDWSNIVGVTPYEDTTPPEITYFVPAQSARVAGAVKISVKAADSSKILKLYCELSADNGETWTEIFSKESENAIWQLDTSEYADGVYLLRAMAQDECGFITSGINQVALEFDNTAPAKVTGVSVQEISPTAAMISWENVPDEDCSYFLVTLIGGGKELHKRSTKLGIALEQLVPDTTYTLSVAAVDKLGNTSETSETLEFSTPKDLEAPVISKVQIQGSSVRAGGELRVHVVAQDTANVQTLYLDYSQDMQNWKTLEMAGASNDFSIIDDDLQEGVLYLRTYAVDEYGNLGDKEAATVSTVVVDNTPPRFLPTLQASVMESGIYLSWNAPQNEEIAGYTLLRATAPDGEYILITKNTTKTFCEDSKIQPATTYYYKMCVADKAGNESAYTEPLEVKFSPDSVAPKISTFYVSPQNQVISDAYACVQVIAEDNLKMDSILLEYQCDDAENWTVLTGENTFNNAKTELRVVADFPQDVMQAQTVRIRVTPKDAYENEASPVIYTLFVDNAKANITGMTAEQKENKIEIVWSIEDVSNVTLMTLYRTVGSGQEYVLVHKNAAAEQLEYSYEDNRLENSGSYTYRLEVVCSNGNVISKTLDPMNVQAVPVPELLCETTQQVGAVYRFDATSMHNISEICSVLIDYGDGTCMTSENRDTAIFEHTYEEEGTYTVRLTCSNADGFSDSVSVTVHVENAASLAQVTVTVKDTAGNVAANTSVYVDVGTDSQVKYETDNNGKITFYTTAGSHEIGVFGNGYLPTTKLCDCIVGAENQVEFAVVKNQLVTASFHITRMNFEQIKAAGIEIADPSSCQIVKIDVSLEYVGKEKKDEKDDKLTLYYDTVTGKNYLPPEEQHKGYQINRIVTNDKREIDTIVLMHIPTEVKFLKEYFNVEMIIINNADEGFTIENSEVTLNLPSGLKLMESAVGSSPRTVSLGDLAGGKQSKSVNWIVCGDSKGSYKISANFRGTLSKFNETICQTFIADQNIVVNGISAVDVTLNIGSVIRNECLYVELQVKNNSSAPIYALSTDIGEILVASIDKAKKETETIGYPEVTIVQTRFKGSNGIWMVKDETTDYIERLDSGETFSVLYSISNFSNEYAFTFLRYIKDSLNFNATFGSRAKVNVTNVAPIDTDSLYYGIDFDEETDYMIVVQNKARRALAGASVKLYTIPTRYYSGGQKSLVTSGTTDSRGRLVIPRGVSNKYYQLCVDCDGYRNYVDSTFGFTDSTANHQTIVTLLGSMETGSFKLSAAKLYSDDNRYLADLLNNSYSIMEGNMGMLTIAVTSSANAEKFELYQGFRRITTATADEGYGELTFRTTLLSDGQNLTVRAYAPTGDYVSTTLHMNVTRRPADIKTDIDKVLRQIVGETGSINCPTPPEMTKHGWSLDLTIKFPDVDGVSSVITMDDSGATGKTDHTNFKISQDEISLTYLLNMKEGKIVDSKQIKCGGIGDLSFGIGFEFLGKVDLSANTVTLSGGVYAEMKSKAEGIIGEYPDPHCYINAKISAQIHISALVNLMVNLTTGSFKCDSFSLGGTFQPEFELDAMVGFKGIIAGGIYGHLVFKMDGVILQTAGSPYFNEVSLTGDAGLVGEVLGFEGKVKLLSGTITFYKRDGTRASAPKRYSTPTEALSDPDYYSPAAISDAASVWNGKMASEATETVLSSDVYTGCAPVLASNGDCTIMAWVTQDASRGAGNAKHIVYSVYNADAEAWSNPLPVDANLNAEYNPVLYVADDGIYLAYQESEAVFENENTMELTEYALQTNLMTAKYNVDTRKFGAAETLVHADGVSYVSAPEFVSDADGNLFAFWQCNQNGNVFANDAANAICYAQWTDEGWSEPTELVADLLNLSDFACSIDENGNLVCAYVINPASDPLQQDARELYLLPMGGEPALLHTGTIENLCNSHICGNEREGFVWMEHGCFYTCTDGENPALLLDAADLHPTGELQMVDNKLFFTGLAENGITLYSANYDSENAAFTTPVIYKNEDNTYYKNICAAKSGSDVLLIAKRESAAFSEDDFTVSAELVGEKFRNYADLELYNCAYAVSDAVPNAELPMTLCIKNNGNQSVSAISATLKDANGSAIAEQTFNVELASGALAELEFSPVLPENCGGAVYAVEVSASGAEDICQDDNTAQIDLSKTDLRVNACLEYDDEKTFVTMTVTNDSPVPSSAVLKAIPQSTGEESISFVSDVIAPHKSAFWTVDAEELLGGKFHDFVDIIVLPDTEDADSSNNSGTLILTDGGFNAYQQGDINFDGVVDERDAVLVLTMYTRSMFVKDEDYGDSFSASQHLAADVNGDGVVTEYDATLILRYFAYTIMLDEDDEPLLLSAYLDGMLNGGSD